MQIEFHDVKLNYAHNNPNSNLNDRFSPPQRILISGASGNGKTTLLSVLYGLRKAGLAGVLQGSILFDGKNISDMSLNQWASLRERVFSISFQDLRLFNALSGLENILVKACQFPAGRQQRVERIIACLGIEELLSKKPLVMSLGEQQRIALARALSVPFRWLLLDEPFSHLDSGNAEKAGRLIGELCRENQAGLIVADHDSDIPLDFDGEISL